MHFIISVRTRNRLYSAKRASFLLVTIFMFTAPAYVVRAQSLEELQQEAAEKNHNLKAQYHRFEAAVQRAEGSGVLPDPNFTFGYFISPIETRVGPQQARFSLVQQFPWFGKLKSERNAAALEAESLHEAFQDARKRLFVEVAQAYFNLWMTTENIAVQQENIKLLQSLKKTAETNFSNERASMADVLRLEIILQDAEAALSVLTKKRKADLRVLNQIIHRDADTEVIPQLNEPGEDYETAQSHEKHPSILAIQKRKQAAEAKEAAAVKSGLPNIAVGLDYALVGKRPNMPDLADNGKNIIMPMVSLSLPIYRKRIKSAVKEQQLLAQSYDEEEKARVYQLGSDREQAQYELHKSRTYVELYENQKNKTRRVLQLLVSKYSTKGSDYQDLLEVQRELLRYEQLEIEARANYRTQIQKLRYINSTYSK